MLLTVLVVSKILYVLGEDIHFHEHMEETLTNNLCHVIHLNCIQVHGPLVQ